MITTAEFVQLGGHGIQLGLDQSAGLIHQVDGLIRKETVRDITVGEGSGCHQSAVGDFDTMENFVTLFQSSAEWKWYLPPWAHLTMTGWKRRSRAASFSMYSRYSSRVVAPIQ